MRGTFAHHADGYVQVDNDAPASIDTADGTVELEAPEERATAQDPQPAAE